MDTSQIQFRTVSKTQGLAHRGRHGHCDKELVLRLLRTGASHAHVALEAGITREYVRQLANQNGLNERRAPVGEADALVATFKEALEYGPYCYDCGAPKSSGHIGPLCAECSARKRLLTAIRSRVKKYFERGNPHDLRTAVYLIRKFSVTPDEFLPPHLR